MGSDTLGRWVFVLDVTRGVKIKGNGGKVHSSTRLPPTYDRPKSVRRKNSDKQHPECFNCNEWDFLANRNFLRSV